MQGRKYAGCSWYLLLKDIFEDFGLLPCPAELALFSFFDGPDEITLVTSTDDFLISSSSDSLFARLCEHIRRFVPITIQDGSVIKYLNVRIIQTELGISIDQTHHIRTSILDNWFKPTKTERLKSADTPYRTDSQYEKDLQEQLPATGTQLAKLEKDHGGKFNALIGQFLHIEQVTRFELGFPVTRLAQYNAAPNAASFAGLKRIARFLATHPHTPIFYPSTVKLTMHQTIRFEVEPGKFIEQLISNIREMYVDADHARDIKTRKSVSCVLSAVCGVLIHWHMGKQSCVAAHSTDAEIRAYFTAVQINKYLRMVDDFMRMGNQGPTVIYEDNAPAIAIMEAGHITGRVKHIAVPTQMIYEDIKLGNNKPKKIDGRLNTADIGTKPLPSSTLHRLMRQGRGQRFYPSPNTEHGKLMQVELVNQRIDEFSNDKAATLIDYHANKNIGAVYDDKGEA